MQGGGFRRGFVICETTTICNWDDNTPRFFPSIRSKDSLFSPSPNDRPSAIYQIAQRGVLFRIRYHPAFDPGEQTSLLHQPHGLFHERLFLERRRIRSGGNIAGHDLRGESTRSIGLRGNRVPTRFDGHVWRGRFLGHVHSHIVRGGGGGGERNHDDVDQGARDDDAGIRRHIPLVSHACHVVNDAHHGHRAAGRAWGDIGVGAWLVRHGQNCRSTSGHDIALAGGIVIWRRERFGRGGWALESNFGVHTHGFYSHGVAEGLVDASSQQ
mmetsp:Transcript_8457/g.15301  ORF Transcript_8457/g.15301 Transcript_8457/m.15301 type:complete len:269 (-) Transcript_8457:316-1122(-)